MLGWIIAILIGGSLLFLVWWLVFESEGVYLGQKTVIGLYDLYAKRYDSIKQFMPEYDHLFLSRPLMTAVAPRRDPLVLDVAVGSGRLPQALLAHILFEGHVVGVDLSRRMLHQAAEKFVDHPERVTLVWSSAEKLPFEDNAFDVVVCLESLEFFADIPCALDEMARALRPGGYLMITNRINTRWMPGRLFSKVEFAEMLQARGFEQITSEAWQADYYLVKAVKAGASNFIGVRPVETILRGEYHFSEDGVLEPAQKP